MNKTQFATEQPAALAALDGQLAELHATKADLTEQLTALDVQCGRLDANAADEADGAYVAAVSKRRQLRRRLDTVTVEIATVTAQHPAAQVAALKAEEDADTADRDAVEERMAEAATELAAYESRLRDRWAKRKVHAAEHPRRQYSRDKFGIESDSLESRPETVSSYRAIGAGHQCDIGAGHLRGEDQVVQLTSLGGGLYEGVLRSPRGKVVRVRLEDASRLQWRISGTWKTREDVAALAP